MPFTENLYDTSGERRPAADFIIPGLDVESVAEAKRLIHALDPVCDIFKVGKHFILDPEWSSFLHEYFFGDTPRRLFLDLKDFDIGESSKFFARQIAEHPIIEYFTVHAVRQTMEAAVSERMLGIDIMAVPLLTSFGPKELKEVYNWDVQVDGTITEFVLLKTELALNCGCTGAIISPLEVAAVREEFGDDLCVITPGSRPPGSSVDDHQRTGTPAQAVLDGADYVVLSRSIIHAPDPRAAFEEITDQIARAI